MAFVVFKRGALSVGAVGTDEQVRDAATLLSPYASAEPATLVDTHPTIYADGRAVPDQTVFQHVAFTTDNEPTTEYRFSCERRCIIIDEPRDPAWLIQHIARLVRVLLRLQLAEQGAMFVHAGMVAIRGQGFAIVGQKRSGKTSSILAALRLPGCSYVTNDDLALVESGGNWVGMGWPRGVSVRSDSRLALAELGGPLLDPSRLSHPANRDLVFAPTESSALIAYPAELADAFGTSVSPTSEVSAVIFPEFQPIGTMGGSLTRVSDEEAGSRLSDSLRTDPNKYEAFLLPMFKMVPRSLLELKLRQLVTRIPCFLLRQSMSDLGRGTALMEELMAKEFA